MNKKRILLTGASGFIGKNIQESFLATKYQILVPTSRDLNCADDASVERFFQQNQVDIVIHAAVKPSHRNAKDFSNLFYTNTRMFFNLEKQQDKYEKMLVIGSGAIYDGENYRPKVKEEQYIDFIPKDEHGYCKYVCAKSIENSRNIYDLRVFGIFGKYEDYTIRFISNAICKAIFDLPITIKQNRKFDYLYIDDLMPILDWFIQNTPQFHSYNITPDHSISLQDLALLIKKLTNKPDLSINIAHDGNGLEYSGNNSRLKAEFSGLGFTTISDAVIDLYNWYIANMSLVEYKSLLVDK